MIKTGIITLFLLVFLISPACGFPGMASNGTTSQIVLTNTTDSDQDIVLLQHLIVLDAAQFKSENKIYVEETLIFKNLGTKNFSGSLRTWLPDGADLIKRSESGEIMKTDMATGEVSRYLPAVQKGNIIMWRDSIPAGSLASLYRIEYFLTSEPSGTQVFTKKLRFPTLINYRYQGKPQMPALILIVTTPEGVSVDLRDENRNKLYPDEIIKEGNSDVNRFNSVQFRELNVNLSKTAAVSPVGIAGFTALGAVILLVFLYPVMRKRSEKLQSIEGKIRDSLKEEYIEPIEEEEIAPLEDEEFSGMTEDELKKQKSELILKLNQLEKEYSSGNLLDEEYEEYRESFRQQIEKINKRLDKEAS